MTPAEVTPATLVRDILRHVAGAPRAFERHRVDYCCHGALPLEEACARVGARVPLVLAALLEEAARPDAEAPWNDEFESLEDLVEHLTDTVHPSSRRDAEALRERLDALPPDALDRATREELTRLVDELAPHLAYEERYVFPYVVALERTGEAPVALFESLADPFQMLLREHEHADHGLEALRALTAQYTPAPDAPEALRALYAALAAYDAALVRHMHLEGNVLFPRAERLESKTRRAHARR